MDCVREEVATVNFALNCGPCGLHEVTSVRPSFTSIDTSIGAWARLQSMAASLTTHVSYVSPMSQRGPSRSRVTTTPSILCVW